MTRAVLIAGPTASGKSGVGLELAARFGGTVINADSMQVYRELRVLTARPSQSEEACAPHRLYGTVSAAQACSVGRWLDDVAQALAEARGEGRLPILVGGTGLYFKALTEGLAPVPDIPAEMRSYWREQAAKSSREALHKELATRDPAMASRLRPADPQRIVRALEVIDATGISLAEWQGGNAAPLLAPSDVLRLVIAPEREPLYAAIDARFDRMIEQGAIEEVRALLDLELDPGLPAMRAHGVHELAAYLSGVLTREEAVAKVKTESRRYAKRQMTWLRRFMSDWQWFPDASTAIVAATAMLATR
ncbi:tRNA (adenosine(37)-N6)-dimethylallyltransferase MiaA [Methyloceanibacter sp.]|uniref:tRNA (adenosine(37)-N6)-dimethylallyltransferase MiaA n=1 Tax=Methyloceanibacter sp. TaxID=1965321 RepID=UPI003D6D5728